MTRETQGDQPAAPDLHRLSNAKRALDSAAIVAVTDASGHIREVNDKFCEISKSAFQNSNVRLRKFQQMSAQPSWRNA